MADKDSIPIQISSESASEVFEEASATAVSGEPGMLRGEDSSVSVPPSRQIPSIVIIQEDGTTSDVIEPFSVVSSSTLDASQTIVDVSEDEDQSAFDDPTVPLVPPRYEDVFPPPTDVDDRTPEPQRPTCVQCSCCCFITPYNWYYPRKVRNSKYILLVLVALLSIPISSIYFGVTYKGSCPMAQLSPMLLIIMGIVGVIFIVVRLMTISSRRRLWKVEEPPRTLAVSLTFMLMIFMLVEMISFYRQKPVFDNTKNPVFCEKTFYDYVFYMNFVVLVTGILALLLHIPRKPGRPMPDVPPERYAAI